MGSFCRPLNSHGFTVCHTVSLSFSRYHDRFLISHGFTNFERIFSQNYSFLKKQTQAAHSNVNKERISSMINKNKRSIRSYLSLTWTLFVFSIWVFSHNHSRITGLQGKEEGISLTPHYHFHLLHRHLDISRAITAKSSPLHIVVCNF